ncbi:CAP-associated domain-containing protein [Mammaliicoccus sp. Dog046]|uniref:CAP-associated domain-containing protein n=1 Tax=Mammaliicoccus sp. Dog046 TaxID=3034233 RepID=UPI002B256733|nr:CAP-associated domain-containing protein [Mammaliicoccus sp. Dog046]WQK84680.1 CAP-associated domain-containing protein [Mammaliicoccus sp. Dog046]
MKNIIIKVVAITILIVVLFYLFYSPKLEFDVLKNPNYSHDKADQNYYDQQAKKSTGNAKLKEGVGTYVYKNINEVIKNLGQPDRVYKVAHGKKEYVFKSKGNYYLVSAKNNKVASVFATGKNVNVSPIKIKQDATKFFNGTNIDMEPIVQSSYGKYQIELSERDIKTQLLIKYGNVYAQVLIDSETNEVMGVQFMDSDVVVEHAPFSMSKISDNKDKKLKRADEQDFQTHMNKDLTLLEMVNQYREMKQVKPLDMNDQLTYITQMEADSIENDIPEDEAVKTLEDGIMKHIDNQKLEYESINQNLAFNFYDVPTLVNSWLNKDTYREKLLGSQYDEFGAGNSREYYSLVFKENKE